MRPVKKKEVGERVVYHPSYQSMNDVGVEYVIQASYHPYSEAKNPLIANLGTYCSYCEEYRAEGDLHVEHIAAKGKGGAESDWENFLLSCNVCNSVKGTKAEPENVGEMVLPHVDNTYLCFLYDESGRVKVNPALPQETYALAKALYDRIGLGRYPGSEELPSERDFRWRHRFEAWISATRYLKQYQKDPTVKDSILQYVQKVGNWSVFFTVFKEIDEMRKALIEEFPGTSAVCFDAENHYEPIPRHEEIDRLKNK